MKLKLAQLPRDDIHKDRVRIPLPFRNGISQGTICKLTANGICKLVEVRGQKGQQLPIIYLDAVTRVHFKLKKKEEADFQLIKVRWFSHGKIFNEGTEFQRDGSQFASLFRDGDAYRIGRMIAHAIHTPGHTPACMTHVI
jgi:hypothetical protein